MTSPSDLVPDLAGLDALDLCYLISVCEMPKAYRNWGERAQAAEDRAVEVLTEMVGYRPGYTVAQYARAARAAWSLNNYTFEGVLKA